MQAGRGVFSSHAVLGDAVHEQLSAVAPERLKRDELSFAGDLDAATGAQPRSRELRTGCVLKDSHDRTAMPSKQASCASTASRTGAQRVT